MNDSSTNTTVEDCVTMSSNCSEVPSSVVSSQSDIQSLEFRVIKICFYCIILLCSSVGNSLVIYIVAGNARMRTPSNYLILNLAVCDLVTPLLSITFDFILEENNYKWIYGAFMCKILWPASTLSATASALTLAAMSLDRYRVIMHPFKPRLTAHVIKVIIALVYLVSFVSVIPYSYVLSLNSANCKCSEKWPEAPFKKFYTLFLSLIQYFLPLMFMVVMYTLALKSLYTSTERTSSAKTAAPQDSLAESSSPLRDPTRKKTSSVPQIAHKILSTVRGGRNEANKRATKMFIVIVMVFAVCMFPNQALWLWADFGGGSENPKFPTATIICWLFTYTNSVCNAAIYAFFSWDFRRGFKRAFKKLCCFHPGAHINCFKFNSSLYCHTIRTEVESRDRGGGRQGEKPQFL